MYKLWLWEDILSKGREDETNSNKRSLVEEVIFVQNGTREGKGRGLLFN